MTHRILAVSVVLASISACGLGGAAPAAPAKDQSTVTPSDQATAAPAEQNAAATADSAATPADGQATNKPTSQRVKRSQTPEMIEKFIDYYLKLYDKQLLSSDWMARCMAVISLARIDDARSTQRLADVMVRDKETIVRIFAWEALHARLARTTPLQREQWTKIGLEMFQKNFLWGDLRVGIVGILADGGPTQANKDRFISLFSNTNSRMPGDIHTLEAMAKLLGRWKSPDLVEGLIRGMGELDTAWRAEFVLRGINAELPLAETLHGKGSTVMWVKTHEAWQEWYKDAKLTEDPQPNPYAGSSALMPAGKKITDTSDPQWKKDLELGRFRLNQLDVGFVIDATGSMQRSITWIQQDVSKMMRAFELISREPRIGVVFYRDRGDKEPIKPVALSGSAEALGKAMRDEKAKGGGDIPEAVFEGLTVEVQQQPWSQQADARKVIVLMGDAPPHEDSNDKIEKLVKDSVAKGFVFYAIKIRTEYRNDNKLPNYDPQLTTYDKIAEVGKGKSFWIDFRKEHAATKDGVALPLADDVPERVILREVLTAAMAEGYQDRIAPFLNVVLQYVDRPGAESRNAFPPAPGHHPPPTKPPKPRTPPPDPQKQ